MKPNKIFVCAAALALGLSSCSDKDWTPGEESLSGAGVFFKPIEKYSITMEPDANQVVQVPVGRIVTAGAVDVPLQVVNVPEGVVVPQSVSFADGQEVAYFDIDVTAMKAKTTGNVELAIDPKVAYIYGEGSTTFNLEVIKTGEWIVLADDMYVHYYNDSYTKDIYPMVKDLKLYYLEGGRRYKIPNFMNSGIDLPFTMESVSYTASKRIAPTSNAIWFWENDWANPDAEYTCWYFYDDANDEYPIWSVDGSEPEIAWYYVFDDPLYYSTGNIYTNGSAGEGWLLFCGSADYTDESYRYLYPYYIFTPKFDPEELERQNAAN